MLTTTIKLLKKHKACEDRFVYLLAHLTAEEKAGIIPLWRVLEVNGINDCLWAFCALSEGLDEAGKRIAVAFANYCAEQAKRAARLAAALAAEWAAKEAAAAGWAGTAAARQEQYDFLMKLLKEEK